MKGIILGAGFTGLSAGIKTKYPVYESSSYAGGICNYYSQDGFHFSQGGPHWIFGNNKGLEFIKSLVELKEYKRKAGIYYNHIFPYPFQTNAENAIECKPNSLKGWLKDNFRTESCNIFFNPFNNKYTCGLYDEVIQDDAFKSPPAGSVGFVPSFYDPVNGLENLVKIMADKCDIKYNKKAVRIFPKQKRVLFSDGDIVEYDKLISTIPLNSCLDMCGKEDHNLPYTSVLVFNIGAEKDTMTPDDHWLYIPFCKSGFYRIGFYSNVDKSKAPIGKVGLSVEMAFKGVDYENLSVERIANEVIRELQDWRFIKDVITISPTWVKTAYTWLYSREERKNQIGWLASRDIISTGRYGKWAFQGITQSTEDGLDV
jgi:protoporphyrinogen oxidase